MIVRNVRGVGAAVQDARQQRGWTQAELARRAGVSRQWIIAFERGKSSAELGAALRTIATLGLAVDLVPEPQPDPDAVDLDRIIDELS